MKTSLLTITFCLSCTFVFAISFDKEIAKTTQGLTEKLQKEKALTNRLEALGQEVEKYNKQIHSLDKQIGSSSILIKQNEGLVRQKVNDLEKLDKQYLQLEEKRKLIETELVKYLSEELAFVVLLDEFSLNSSEEMIQQEIFSILSAESKKNIDILAKEQNKVVAQIKKVEQGINGIKEVIEQENNRQKSLDNAKKKQKEALIALNNELKRYNEELNKILQERENLQRLLEELNVKQKEEKDRLARKRERELAQRNMQKASNSPKNIEKIDVRQVGSSYHDVKTVKYKGKKTIPPLDRYKIDRKFGPYYDPIYNLRTFSESVTFTPLEKNARVKSILNGEIIFAKEVPLLKKVVVIKHDDDIHTIYAQLDKIAPNISVGKKISKGTIVGSVDHKLMLEVTQKNLHVNPMDLISVKK